MFALSSSFIIFIYHIFINKIYIKSNNLSKCFHYLFSIMLTYFTFLNIFHLLQYFFSGFKTASRYTQEHFFQDTLMNVSFRNLNEIIHSNADNIPEYIRHYASAIFANGSFSNNSSKILDEIF